MNYLEKKKSSFVKIDIKWQIFFGGPFESLKGEHITNSNSTQKNIDLKQEYVI